MALSNQTDFMRYFSLISYHSVVLHCYEIQISSTLPERTIRKAMRLLASLPLLASCLCWRTYGCERSAVAIGSSVSGNLSVAVVSSLLILQYLFIFATGSPVLAFLLMLVSPDIKNFSCSAVDPAIAGIRAVTDRGSCCCWHSCYCWSTCCCWRPSVADVHEDIIVLVLAPGSLFQAITKNNILLRLPR